MHTQQKNLSLPGEAGAACAAGFLLFHVPVAVEHALHHLYRLLYFTDGGGNAIGIVALLLAVLVGREFGTRLFEQRRDVAYVGITLL